MKSKGVHKIRPAGRLVLTIGRDLIQDVHAAVVELVKNAYDADSPDVRIQFRKHRREQTCSIVITDHGHGMTRDAVINHWMVPSTRDKLDRRLSPTGRVMQGRKGVGRYAASVLGTDLYLETVTPDGEKTEVYIDWQVFEDSAFLDDVDILVETSQTSEPPGTRLTIRGDERNIAEWTRRQFQKLRFELRKLKSPVETDLVKDDFRIYMSVADFPEVDDMREIIEPYPIFDLFDYRISGTVKSCGSGTLEYAMQKIRNAPLETIAFDHGRATNCGELFLDIRVYDREPDSIKSLIGRGLRNDSGDYVGNLEARQLLNEFNGIGVYRNGFRIRPLGDPDFDWLTLNEQRVQNPSLRIGSNQVIGFVQIQLDEKSGLIEKSARDGLRENSAFDSLKEIATEVIALLESRRFEYRQRAGLSRPAAKMDRQLERLFSSDQLTRDVQRRLVRAGVPENQTDEIVGIIRQDEEEKNRVADDIRTAVAVYQGQATLGKIINVVLHEGRRPLNYFRNEIPNLRYWHGLHQRTGQPTFLDRIISISDGLSTNAEYLVDLFRRLDPLAAGNRAAKRKIYLKKALEDSLSVFWTEMRSQDVTGLVDCPDDFTFTAWPQDIYIIFTNLIDNSIYWMREKGTPDRKINIVVSAYKESGLSIDYRDTGPGIEPTLIASGVIFEPHFSTKPLGTGLGLAIAGEAAARNGLDLKAIDSESGVWFRLESSEESRE